MTKQLKLLLTIFFIAASAAYAQPKIEADTAFISYLCRENLEAERMAYYRLIDIQSLPQQYAYKDMLYLSALHHDTSMIKQIAAEVKDTANILYVIYASLLTQMKEQYNKAFSDLKAADFSGFKIKQLTDLLLCNQDSSLKTYESTLFYSTLKRINQLEKRSVLVAAFLSAILPGAGKYYLLQNAEGNAAFSLTLLTAAPLVECILKLVFISTGTILTGLVFVPVYVANIYGTVKAKKALTKKLKQQLKHEISDYCIYQLHH